MQTTTSGRVNYFNKDPKSRTEHRNCNLTTPELQQIYDMGFRHFKIHIKMRSNSLRLNLGILNQQLINGRIQREGGKYRQKQYREAGTGKKKNEQF